MKFSSLQWWNKRLVESRWNNLWNCRLIVELCCSSNFPLIQHSTNYRHQVVQTTINYSSTNQQKNKKELQWLRSRVCQNDKSYLRKIPFFWWIQRNFWWFSWNADFHKLLLHVSERSSKCKTWDLFISSQIKIFCVWFQCCVDSQKAYRFVEHSNLRKSLVPLIRRNSTNYFRSSNYSSGRTNGLVPQIIIEKQHSVLY